MNFSHARQQGIKAAAFTLPGLAWLCVYLQQRHMGYVLSLFLAIACIRHIWKRSAHTIIGISLAAIVVSYLPLDFRYANDGKGLRLAQYHYGYPSEESIEMARQGTVYLASCFVYGNEPRWVIVW